MTEKTSFLCKKRHYDDEISENIYKLNINLPVYKYAQEILDMINYNQVCIIAGRTGCGKTTQIPQLIYNSNDITRKEVNILITQPRRLAAISIANRLTKELKAHSTHLVGYHVGLNSSYNKSLTKIIVKTTGLFLEELIHDFSHLPYTHIILDEVHERDINIDFVLILVKRLILAFPKIKVILMSATISTNLFKTYFQTRKPPLDEICPIVPIYNIQEAVFEVTRVFIDEIINKLYDSMLLTDKTYQMFEKRFPMIDEKIYEIAALLIKYLHEKHQSQLEKGILVFLPGFGEIQTFRDILTEALDLDLETIEINILHSNISDDEQEKVFIGNKMKRKIILATNIAESSITISGNDFIIDFCLIKELQYDHFNHKESLDLKWASKANCEQRAGRTGRVARGIAFRLIPLKFYEELDIYPSPEILRVSLEKLILKIKVYNCGSPEDILKDAIQAPEVAIISTTIQHLQHLGALIATTKDNTSGDLTSLGKVYAELPIDIKYSRLIMLSYAFGMTEPGIVIAAILSQEKKLFKSSSYISRSDLFDSKQYFSLKSDCDMITSYLAYKTWERKFGIQMISHEYGRIKKDIGSKIRKKEFDWCNNHLLDSKTLKESIVLIADLKKRLINLGVYRQRINTEGDSVVIAENFSNPEKCNLFKYIIGGSFYNYLLSSSYCNEKQLSKLTNEEIINKHGIMSVIYKNIFNLDEDIMIAECNDNTFDENACKALLTKIISGDNIQKITNLFTRTTILLNSTEALKKLLFVPTYAKRDINNEIIENKNELKKPEYLYELMHNDLFSSNRIDKHNSSINYIAIEPLKSQLTDNFHVCDGFLEHNNHLIARNICKLPNRSFLAQILIMIFSPYTQFYSNKKETQYDGFKVKGFGKDFRMTYLLSGFDIKAINVIRTLLNQQVKANLKLGIEEEDNYNKRVEKLTKEFITLIEKPRLKIIARKQWEMLYEQIYCLKQVDTFKEIKEDLKSGDLKNCLNDFLPPLIPLSIKEDYRLWTQDGLKSLQNERHKYNEMKALFTKKMEERINIIYHDKPQLCCGKCNAYLCSMSSVKIMNSNNMQCPLSLFQLDGWMSQVIKEFPITDSLIQSDQFVLRNKASDFMPDTYISCNEMHVLGVKYKDEYYVLSYSDLKIKYPMQNYVEWNDNVWKNNFEGLDKEMIKQDKMKREFIETKLQCEVCEFDTKNDKEFLKHLKDPIHKFNLKDLEEEEF